MTTVGKAASAVLDRARALAEARTQEADAFLRAKMSISHCTDGQAERMAISETQDAVTLAQAEDEIARWRMHHLYDEWVFEE
jgi:hypothetical protein